MRNLEAVQVFFTSDKVQLYHRVGILIQRLEFVVTIPSQSILNGLLDGPIVNDFRPLSSASNLGTLNRIALIRFKLYVSTYRIFVTSPVVVGCHHANVLSQPRHLHCVGYQYD